MKRLTQTMKFQKSHVVSEKQKSSCTMKITLQHVSSTAGITHMETNWDDVRWIFLVKHTAQTLQQICTLFNKRMLLWNSLQACGDVQTG